MIQREITLSKEELEKYLQGEEKIEIEIRDEEDKVVEKKVIVKRVNENVNNRERKKNDEESRMEHLNEHKESCEYKNTNILRMGECKITAYRNNQKIYE
ncbi:hypothetical protein RhiirA4_476683 [Rhizophagus irregularis]|uniref:Uncharacterized protein n=1 Tax=Rhizophagus irregularis TaxID=588596 RepID=A0A2I1HC40_9GLOM|nr:hypothetical protein RhiirA4_476683 [Rhizophagus irregularis]